MTQFPSYLPEVSQPVTTILTLWPESKRDRYPGHLAGNKPTTDFHPSMTPSSLTVRNLVPRRTRIIRWCAPQSATYVLFTLNSAIGPGSAVLGLVDAAFNSLMQHIQQAGDGLIPQGLFTMEGANDLELYVANANNHQQTYGVLAAAMWALGDYMGRVGPGGVTFSVYDGANQVAQGSIE